MFTALSTILVLAAASASPDFAFAQQGGKDGGNAGGDNAGRGGPTETVDKGRQGDPERDFGTIYKDITGVGAPSAGRNDPVDVIQERDAGAPAAAPGNKGGGQGGTAGGPPDGPGSGKGDLFGDLWVIERNPVTGEPILTPEGFVQPLDADGNPIPLDEEGHPIDESLVVEVELGRLNVGRAPSKVIEDRADEVITMLSSATALSTDAAGRLVLTIDGVEKTIDAPLDNLAIYVSLLTTGSIPGLTPEDVVGTEYDFLVDGQYTSDDLAFSAALLAAATDKEGAFTTDEIAYIDAFLGINTTTTGDVTYSVVDYSEFTYDRSDTYEGVTATVLVEQADGSFVPQSVDIYEAVFGSVDTSAAGTLDAYTIAADDARQVIEFIHEYAVPE